MNLEQLQGHPPPFYRHKTVEVGQETSWVSADSHCADGDGPDFPSSAKSGRSAKTVLVSDASFFRFVLKL